jgi:hypothetical protein
MHAVLHLAECIRQFGPPHAHWTFPWERNNGMMGDTPMNRHHVEEQLMRAFARQMRLRLLPSLTASQLSQDEEKLFLSMWGEVKSAARGFTGRQIVTAKQLQSTDARVTGNEPIDAELLHTSIRAFKPGVQYQALLDSCLRLWKNETEPDRKVVVDLNYTHARGLRLFADIIGTELSRQHRSSHVFVWIDGHARPAQCMGFIKPRLRVQLSTDPTDLVVYEPLLVQVAWYARYDGDSGEYKSDPPPDDTEHTWSDDRAQLVASGEVSRLPKYVPVHRIRGRYVKAPFTKDLDGPAPKTKPKKGDAPMKRLRPLRLFRTCPLPLQLPF